MYRFGPRFPSMINTYDDALRKLAKSIAIEKGLKSPIREGTYIMVGGPSFETVAESRLLRMFGADAVGELCELIKRTKCFVAIL